MITQKRWFRQVTTWGMGALAFLCLWLLWGDGAEDPRKTKSQAIHLSRLDADVFFMSIPQLVQRGPPGLVVVRLNSPAIFEPHYYKAEQLPAPLTVDAWAERLQAPIVFNAGQFDEQRQYLGWLKSRGQWLSKTKKPTWMGLLVSNPSDPKDFGVHSRIVDLEQASDQIAQRYDNVMQSMMLVDDGAHVRVRRSPFAACRTVVAEDTKGRLLILVTEGAVTLSQLADWLPISGLGIVRAMNLDGGIESQLSIQTPELNLTLYGQYGKENKLFEAHPGTVRYPLPTVVSVRQAALTHP